MLQCSYVILDHCKSDLSSDGVPCLLLLDIGRDSSARQFKVFVTPDIGKLFDALSSHNRMWALELLFDLYEGKHNPEAIGMEFEKFYSMDVGPLRTSISGAIEANEADNLLQLICIQIGERSQECSTGEGCLFCSFQELIPDMLRQFRQRFSLTDSNRQYLKRAVHSVSFLAIMHLTS